MKNEELYSWIFLATAMACQSGGSTTNSIVEVADGINHAVPTQKEIQSSIKWLIDNGLIKKHESKYNLTLTGKTIYNQASNSSKLIAKIWNNLSQYFAELINERIHIPQFSKELYLIITNRFNEKNSKHIINTLKKLNHDYKSGRNMSVRLIAAILKNSNNSISQFDKAVHDYSVDWRDTLMSAGFGNDINLHKNWIYEQMEKIHVDNNNNESRELLIL